MPLNLKLGMDMKLANAEKAVQAAMEFVAASAREHHVPGSGGIRSLQEHIRDSLTTEIAKSDGGNVAGYVVCRSPHGAYVEYGTGPVGAASGGNGSGTPVSYTTRSKWVYPVEGYGGTEFFTTSGQPAKPFMYPAFVEAQQQILAIMASAMKE